MRIATASRIGLLFGINLAAIGCATIAARRETRAFAATDYKLIVQANDPERRFDLTFLSNTSRPICFSLEDWPNNLGESAGGGGRALLHTATGDMPASDTNFGFCVGPACELHVQPKQSLKGYISYKEFGDPLRIASDASKRLEYRIKPYFCAGRP